jgi:hypothetical protein
MCSRDSVPPKKPCPFLLPRGLVQGGTTCSLGVRASQVLPQPTPEKELFPLFRPLPSFPATRVAVSRQSGSQGVEVLALWHLPPKRAPTRVAFFTDGTVPPLRTNPRRGVFFPLKIPRTLTGLRSLSLRPRSTRLSEGGTAIPGAPCGCEISIPLMNLISRSSHGSGQSPCQILSVDPYSLARSATCLHFHVSSIAFSHSTFSCGGLSPRFQLL